MPELPDITVYVEHLERRLLSSRLTGVRVMGPNVLRTFDPPIEAAVGASVRGISRMAKRIVIALEGDLWLVIHLMISGRLRWTSAEPDIGRRVEVPARGRLYRPGGKLGLATFEFSSGTLVLTEASTRKRASLHLVRGETALRALDPGGVEPLEATPEAFRDALTRENRTLKRALTDPRLVSGVGNAYSDEILHRAKLSPMQLTSRLDDEAWSRLHGATRAVLIEWTERLRAKAGDAFPSTVTAFHEEMAVHGRYRKPCPVCGAPVQRIVYAENEANYCARCQTGGRLLADRALSRLLRDDWPKRLEDLEGE